VRNEKWQQTIRNYKSRVRGVDIIIIIIIMIMVVYACISITVTIILNTCGTHLGDTKLVASIDERPVSDSISINLIFVSVGTIAYKQNRTMQL